MIIFINLYKVTVFQDDIVTLCMRREIIRESNSCNIGFI